MSTSLNNSASPLKDNFPTNNIDQKGKQQSFDGNKNNWTNGLVVLNELDTSDDDDSSSTNSSFTSEVSHSTTHNSAVFSDPPNYNSSKISNSCSISFSKPELSQSGTDFYSDPKKNLETNAKTSSSTSSCNSKISKSTTTSNFSMEVQEDQDRDSCRSDDTDSPVGPPVDKKVLPIPQTSSTSTMMPNYVNVTKDANIVDVLSDDDPDDIRSGKVIGANLSDEENGADLPINNLHNGYSRDSRDNHQSRSPFRESPKGKYTAQLGAPPIPPPPLLRKSRSRERPPPPPVRSTTGPMVNPELCRNSFEPVFDVNRSSGMMPNIQYSGTPEPEQSIRDRERELEKIHRRSRELMLSPRTIETSTNSLLPRDTEKPVNNGNENATIGTQCHNGSRENSADRMSSTSAASSAKRRTTSPRPESLSSGVVPDGWRPSFIPTTYQTPMRGSPATKLDTNNQLRSHQSPPPPLPPRVQSPNGGTCSDSSVGMANFPSTSNNNNNSKLFGRYRSTSPTLNGTSGRMIQRHQVSTMLPNENSQGPAFPRQNRLPPLPSYQNVKSQNGKIPPHHLRVQSPNRNDFKDFSTSGPGGPREFRSPVKQLNPRISHANRNQENGNNNLGNPFLPRAGQAYIFGQEDDEDSGADSLNDQSLQSSLCGDSSGGGNSNNIGTRTNSNSRGRNPRYRLQQANNSSHQGGYGGCSGNARSLVPYSTELVPVLTSNCNCNMNVQQQQPGCLMQQHVNNNNGLQQSCGCFHLQCTATNNTMMNNNQLQTIPLSVDRRLMQLEGDKDTLQLQVAVLSDQIESASDKIGDMEKLLDDKKEVLRKTEDMLARETLTRSSLETQKLELMSEVANLKLRQTSIDKENMDLRKRLARTLDLSTAATAALAAAANAAAASNHNHHLNSSTGKVSAAVGATSLTITEKASDSESPPQHYRQREHRNEVNHSKHLLMSPHNQCSENGNYKTDGYSKAELSSVQGYGTLPRRSKKSSSSSANSSCITTIQGRGPCSKDSPPIPLETHFGIEKSNSSYQANRQLKHQPQSWDWDGNKNEYLDSKLINNVHSGSAPSLAGFSYEQHNFQNLPHSQDGHINTKLETGESNLMKKMLAATTKYSSVINSNNQNSSSASAKSSASVTTSKPKGFKKIFGKLRRTNSGSLQQQQQNNTDNNKEETKEAMNYNATHGNSYNKNETHQYNHPNHIEKPNDIVSSKGSNNSGFAPNNIGNGYFHRGGFRASAGSRYSDWMGGSTGIASSTNSQVSSFAPISTLSSRTTTTSNHSTHQPFSIVNGGKSSDGMNPLTNIATNRNGSMDLLSLPIKQWSVDIICSWFEQMGLFMYIADVRRHLRTGSQLLEVNSYELETKLNMRNSLHRKKILIALDARKKKDEGGINQSNGKGDYMKLNLERLDHQWVVRWLDDVGLPQYKDRFLEARVDGRVLNLLTVDDVLVGLRISNQLHHLSIKRGIQILRSCNFDPTCLKRRSSGVPGISKKDFSKAEEYSTENISHNPKSTNPNEVVYWTNHRVMEWLRSVDLSEYAPNLRGSGVHGALMVYEPKFNSELLAALLSIPTNKTLLRRHLSLHYRELIGREIMEAKREACESEPDTQQLTPTAKVKPHHKRPQFTLTRKGKKSASTSNQNNESNLFIGTGDLDDLLCPWIENLSKLSKETGHNDNRNDEETTHSQMNAIDNMNNNNCQSNQEEDDGVIETLNTTSTS